MAQKTAFLVVASMIFVLLSGMAMVRAGDLDVEIHCFPKEVSEKVNPGSGEGSKAITKENWVYDVMIENKMFKDLANVEVKYIIFFQSRTSGRENGPGIAAPNRKLGAAVAKAA